MYQGWLTRLAVRTLVLSCLTVAAVVSPADGASREMTYVQALRDRGFYDYAIIEIDRLRARPNVPDDLRVTLEYERALTQLLYARSLVNPEAQAKELNKATASLEHFISAHPDNPLVSRTHSELARIFLERARLELWQARPDDPRPRREAAHLKARELLGQAKTAFQQAHDRSKTEYEKFPKTRIDDPKTKEECQRALSDYLKAQLNLATCDYEEALTYEPTTSERRRILTKAADEAESLHVKYRSQGVGLRAFLLEGMCFEAQGDLRKAAGVYEELLHRPDENEFVRQIKDHAEEHGLACLNDGSAKEPLSVINKASQWLSAAKDRLHSEVALGIRWQRAVAADRLAAAPNAGGERERWLKLAVDDAREVSRLSGPHHSAALAMVGRLNSDRPGKNGEPRDFTAGFSAARKNIDDIQALKERLDGAGPDDKPKIERELREHLVESAGRLKRALAVADAHTNHVELNRARYSLAFVDYELKEYDEAAILAEYAARSLRTAESELARESAWLALVAYDQELDSYPEGQRLAIARLARPIVEFLIHSWPDHERSNEGRLALGKMFDKAKEPLEAARWFAGVTQSSEFYAEAQIGAGRQYWVAALLRPKSTPTDSSPSSKAPISSSENQVKEWTGLAQEFLQRGIQKAGDLADGLGNPPAWLTVGRTALANIDIGLSRYDDAIKLLTESPHSVVQSIAVTDEAKRPAEGVKGRPFASYVYQTLLRAQIGAHRIDDSLHTMQSLEKTAGTGAEGVTGIYVSLGKEIEQEIRRLNAANDSVRLGEVRKSFERFLDELARRRDSMTYGSLRWMAETYTGLGEGMSDDREAARAYFAKGAEIYEQLLSRADAAGAAGVEDRKIGLQLRLSACLRRQGNYDGALKTVRAVIAKKPKTLDVQIAAAHVLQDWGASGERDAERHSIEAIRGLPKADGQGAVWGWAEIADRLQRWMILGKADNEIRAKYFEARFAIPECRRQFAILQKDKAMRSKVLEVARGEINAFALVAADVGDESWRKLDALYQQVEGDLGRKATPLKRPDLRSANAIAPWQPVAVKPVAVDKNAPHEAAKAPPLPGATVGNAAVGDAAVAAAGRGKPTAAPAKSAVNEPGKPARSSGPSTALVLLGLVAGVSVTTGIVVWNIRRQQAPRSAFRSLASPDFVDLPVRPARAKKATPGEPLAGAKPRATRPASPAAPRNQPPVPKPAKPTRREPL